MKRFVMMCVAVAVAFTFSVGCEKMQPTQDSAKKEEAMVIPETGMPAKALSAATIVIGGKTWTVEVASTEQERIKGLGGRDSLAANSGMWFVFPGDSTDPFWMKDTNFDLDIIFVGADMKVVDVKPGNIKLSETLIQPAAPYRYALEVNTGESAGIAAGTLVEYRMGPK